MSLPIVFRSAAQHEFDEAADWYETQQAGLGGDFVAEVSRVLDVISDQPKIFPVVEADIRVMLVRRFPYAIYYRVKPTRIVVIAVFHTSRNPKVWKSRR